EHITDPAELETCFDELIGYHELRRIAVSGVAPFLDDPLKKPFHIEMMKRGVLCVTALRAGGRGVSLQMDMIGRGEVHLALGAYAPWVSRFAPGKIHILEFARMLADRGCRDIDLTPGADPYKGEFATRWDRVHALVVSPTHCHHHLSR